MQDILDVWLKVQAAWLYLEPIFSSEDIMAQMPEEGRRFTIVDATWKECMSKTTEDPLVIKATDQPGLLQKLRDALDLLDLIQKGLNDYLEEKRLYFTRFFFLSNDELLEILSETKDPTRVQPHLKKCFEGIAKLNFNDKLEILAMISSEKEEIAFSQKIDPAKARGMVEKWLLQVQTAMLENVRRVTLLGTDAYADSKRTDWVQKWPGQVVLGVSQVFWTKDAQDAIEQGTLKEYVEILNAQINDIVHLVRGRLPTGIRITLSALTVIDVHARDVTLELANQGISSNNDFDWLKQVRYYIHKDETDEMYVHLINTEYPYGYEYLGNSGRLVITPLTDRCYRTLMGALKLYLGGAPEGPAGTGKTETTKDLAKALAKQCVVFNCSDGLDYKAMGKFFKGLAACGAWACFDEFNRIEVEVLSVVAQQILCIQNAVQRGLQKFIFEGTELNLNHQCAVFITMNPGYAGRSELPDNLKVLFRPVAMMVPNYAMIGEISLYSVGFENSRSLAQKIVATYTLCSEQLSSQHHYDYGMRAVKSVLTAAGNLKLQQPNEEEDILMLRAIVDVNIPKFLAHDVPLFNGIVSDLFPGTVLPNPDYELLNETLEAVMTKHNYEATDWVKSKVQQIYEMILVRHGFMIVGAALGGKTVNYQCLAEALTIMAPQCEEHIMPVEYRIINPKSITMKQLYGSFDPVSHEWSDGVIPINYREQANLCNVKDYRQWLIFDGPVDAVWIENMNTVLDDNKKLCLMSGEIIQMGGTMSMMFEAADLEQASPATVSRCGMIYLEPYQLGWKPLVNCYMNQLPAKIDEGQKQMLRDLFDWLMDPCLAFIEKQKFMIPSSSQQLSKSLITLFNAHLDEWQDDYTESLSIVQSSNWLLGIFLFSMTWSVGATINANGREKFDKFFREILSGTQDAHPRPKSVKLSKQNNFPDRNTIYDFCFVKKGNGQWENWSSLIENIEFPASVSVREMIIPNSTTVQQNYFLKTLCLNHSLPLLFVGPTGTGKSALTNTWLLEISKTKENNVGYVPLIINYSARTTAEQTQDSIMAKMDRRRKGVYGPPVGKKCVVFVDDLSMPQKEIYGAQPPIELLRTWLDHDFFYDLKDMTKFSLQDVQLLAAMGPPGGGSNDISQRLSRHLSVITIHQFSETTMTHIFSTITNIHFKRGAYDGTIMRLGKVNMFGVDLHLKTALVVI